MGNNLLFTMKCLFPLFMGGLAVLNSCKEDHPVINEISGAGKVMLTMSMYTLMTAMIMVSAVRNI